MFEQPAFVEFLHDYRRRIEVRERIVDPLLPFCVR